MRYFFEDVYEHLQIEKHVNRACCPPPNECYIWEFDKYLKLYEEEEKNPKIKGIFPHPYEYSNLIINYCDDFVKRKTPFITTSTYEIYKISFKNDIFETIYDRWFNEYFIEIYICKELFEDAYPDFYKAYKSFYAAEVFDRNNIPLINPNNNKLYVLPIQISLKYSNDNNWKYELKEKLFHEMHHAYTDYKLTIAGKDTFVTYQKRENYKNVVNATNNKSKDYKYYLGKLAYCCFDLEINAFISEIAAAYDKLKQFKFKQGDISNTTDEESIELINDTETYKRLLEFESLVNKVKNCDKNDKKEILNIWNELQPQHYYDKFSKLIDFIEYRYKKMYNRCVDIASHIITVKQNDERTSGVF